MDHPLPWLRYVDAGDLGRSAMTFEDMKVESVSGDRLGKVDGFVVDASSGRPYHVAVDAGGWFKSKLFLLPIGHVGLTGSGPKAHLVANVSKEHIDRYPGFDRGEFLHADVCTDCRYRSTCYGIRRGYADLYGTGELRTVC